MAEAIFFTRLPADGIEYLNKAAAAPKKLKVKEILQINCPRINF